MLVKRASRRARARCANVSAPEYSLRSARAIEGGGGRGSEGGSVTFAVLQRSPPLSLFVYRQAELYLHESDSLLSRSLGFHQFHMAIGKTHHTGLSFGKNRQATRARSPLSKNLPPENSRRTALPPPFKWLSWVLQPLRFFLDIFALFRVFANVLLILGHLV